MTGASIKPPGLPEPPDEKTDKKSSPGPKPGKAPSAIGPDERQFLPAALEIMETPAHPLGRTLALVIAAFFVIALAWSLIGKLDVVAVAGGSIVPAGGVKKIQPVEIGIIRSILVTDSQFVKKGEPLIYLDSTDSEVDTDQVIREKRKSGLEVKRLEALLGIFQGHDKGFIPPEDSEEHAVHEAIEQLNSDTNTYNAHIEVLNAELDQRYSEEDVVLSEIHKLSKILPLLEEYEQMLIPLMEKQYYTKPEWLEIQRKLIETRMNMRIEKFRLEEAKSAINAAKKEKEKFKAASLQQVFEKLRTARDSADSAGLTLRKAKKRESQMALSSPVDGVVQQLSVHTIGGVVTPAEILMHVVPRTGPLEVRCRVLNKDIGFIRAGQVAEVKVEAFPFTKYGIIDGLVLHISKDAIPDENLGLVYDVTIIMAATQIYADSRMVDLSPGMAVTAEIKTGKRKIIEYLLSPLMRYQDEALRER